MGFRLIALVLLGLVPCAAGRAARLPAGATASLEGQVEGKGGPLARASVGLRLLVGRRELPQGEAQTDKSGTFRAKALPPGAYALILRAPGHAAARVTRWVLPGGNQLGRHLLAPSAVLSGHVVNDLGAPVAGARVDARPGPDVPGIPVSVAADRAGRFTVDGLQSGSYELRVNAGGHREAVRLDLVAPARDVTVRLTRLYRVRGLAIGADGRARPGVEVRIAGSGIWPGRSVKVRLDGSFEVVRVPAGVYELAAMSEARPGPALASRVLAGLPVGPHPPPPVLLTLEPGQRLSGVVQEEGGGPVPGALLSLGSGSVSVMRQRVVSDAQGRFVFPPLASGPYNLGVWSRGFLPVVSQSVALPTEQPLVLALSRGATLTGRVVDEGGAPLQGVGLRAVYRAGPGGPAVGELGVLPGPVPPIPPAAAASTPSFAPVGGAATSDAGGDYRLSGLQPGELQVVASYAGYVETRSRWIKLQGAGARSVPPLALPASALLSGRIVDGRGLGIAAARVTVSARGDWTRTVFSDRLGDYGVDGVRGPVEVEVSRRGYLPRSVRLRVRGGQDRQLDVALETAEGLVSGFVLDPSRLPVAGARVKATRGRHSVRGRTDRSGFFQLAGVGQGKLLELVVTHPDFCVARERVRQGRAGDVEIRLRYRAAVAGEVVDRNSGAPVGRFVLKLSSAGQRRAVPINSQRGEFEVRGVDPGTVELRVEAEGYASAARTVVVKPATRPLELTLEGVRFVLARAGRIEGRVSDLLGRPVAGALVQAGGIGARTTADGGFTLDGVAEGTHRVVVTLKGQRIESDPVFIRGGETAGPLRLELR